MANVNIKRLPIEITSIKACSVCFLFKKYKPYVVHTNKKNVGAAHWKLRVFIGFKIFRAALVPDYDKRHSPAITMNKLANIIIPTGFRACFCIARHEKKYYFVIKALDICICRYKEIFAALN